MEIIFVPPKLIFFPPTVGEEKGKIYTPAVKRSIKIRQYIIKGRYLKFIVSGESENEKYILKSNAKIRNDLRKQQYAIEDLVRKTREHPAPSLSSMRSSLLKIFLLNLCHRKPIEE